jgi:hypothetical protein
VGLRSTPSCGCFFERPAADRRLCELKRPWRQELERAHATTIRLRLLKVGAQTRIAARKLPGRDEDDHTTETHESAIDELARQLTALRAAIKRKEAAGRWFESIDHPRPLR